jgi:uncharacterized protein YjdB
MYQKLKKTRVMETETISKNGVGRKSRMSTRNLLSIWMAFLVIGFTYWSCTDPNDNEPTVDVTSVSLSASSLTLMIDEQATLTADLKPDNATIKTVSWSSSKSSIAKVENGIVTALAEGETTITAKAGEKTATCKIKVNPIPDVTVEVRSVSLDKSSLALTVGEQSTLIATISPNDATNKTVNWSSSKPAVAKVENGAVTTLAEGETVITASAGGKTATCTVTVKNAVIAVTEISLNKTSLTLNVGAQESINATIKPDNATDKTITWTSSKPMIATVENGKVTAIAEGETVITAKAGEKTATCTVKVEKVSDEETGSCGNGVTWTYTKSTHTLKICGSGAITSMPWTAYKNEIQTLIICSGVTSVPNGAFTGYGNLQTVTLEDGTSTLTFNGSSAFANSSLRTLYLGRNLNYEYSVYAPFRQNTSLQTLTIGSQVTAIGNDLFYGCTGLNSVTINAGCTKIGDYAFYSCSGLTSVNLGTVATIGDYAFAGCINLPSITFTSSVKTIGKYAFNKCNNLLSLTIPASVTTIRSAAFSEAQVQTVKFEDGTSTLTFDGPSAFENSSLKTVYLGRNLNYEYSVYAPFRQNTSLQTLTIGSQVTAIGNDLFYGCTGLNSVTNQATTPQSVGSNAFYNVTISSIPLKVPSASISAYRSAAVWKDFGSISGI